MNVAALLLGLALGQPAEPDYYPLKSRNIKLPVVFKKDKAAIREVQLFVSRDQGATWELAANDAPPSRESFAYHAKEDGLYWFHLVEIDLKGRREPADLTKVPPDLKVLVDTAAPVVRFTDVRRLGDEVVVQWTVEEKHPDEAATKVVFRPAGAADPTPWQEVSVPESSRTGVRFNPGVPGAVVVKVTAQDLVGSKGEAVREVPAAGGTGQTTTSLSPGIVAPLPPVQTPPAAALPDTLAPLPPTGPAPVPAVPAPTFDPPTAPPVSSPMGVVQPIATGQGVAPVAAAEPRPPIATTAGPVAAAPVYVANPAAADLPRVDVINQLRFNLAYNVEQNGPSGISRVDLWVTRDDGRSWGKWSQHDGRETPIRVTLDVPGNRAVEGPYGFRLVPVSGAGLSDNAPAGGDAPDMRVVVDVTPPVIKLFQPYSEPNAPDTLVVPWEAADKNFGDEPIALDWSELPTGPWRPVAGGAGDGVVPVAGVAGGVTRRLPNSGRYAWRVPANLPTHKVYLKVSARDQAGNVSEVMTPHPVLVDLARPRVKISGIVTAPPAGRP